MPAQKLLSLPRRYLRRKEVRFVLPILLIGIFIFVALTSVPALRKNLTNFLEKLTAPKVDYSFQTAPRESGFALLNENKQSGFRVLIGNTDAPKSPEARFEVGKTWLDFALANNFSNTGFKKETQNGKDVIVWKDVLANTDASYQMVNDGLKESMIIKNPQPAQKAIADHTLLSLSFDLTTFGVTPKNNLAGKLSTVFLDKSTREYRFHLDKPYLVDAKGARFDALDYELVPQGTARIPSPYLSNLSHLSNLGSAYALTVGIGDRYTLRLTLPREWLTDPNRAYPVIIDPTITHNTQTAFATGTLNRVKDEGSADASPLLTSSYHELPADINTVGLWHMNEASGNAADSSGNGNNLTSTGTTIVAGKLGNSRSFNGSSDYLSISKAFEPPTATWEVWVNFNNFNQVGGYNPHVLYQADASGARETRIFVGTNGIVYWYVYNASYVCQLNSTTALQTGQWYHLTGQYGSGGCNLYINGKLEASNTTTAGPGTGAVAFAIGRLNVNGTGYVNGLIDEVRISNIARTPEEIKQDAQRFPYSVFTSPVMDLTAATSWTNLTWLAKGVRTGDGETPISTSGLVSQWNFNETSGTTAAAAAGSCGASCNGTLTNFASTGSQDALAGSGWTSANRRWGAGALMFDGTNDYVDSGNNSALNLTGPLSVESWFKIGGTCGANASVLIKSTDYTGYGFYNPSCSSIQGIYGNGTTWIFTPAYTTNVGDWYYAVTTYDGSNVRLYINGQQIGNPVALSVLAGNTNSLKIGSHYSLAQYFNGAIDSTRIYSRALTAAEILANYQAGNIELQTRTSADNSTWEAWKPVTGESQLLSMDADQANWNPVGTQTNPGTSCSNILYQGGSTGDGLYWINPGGVTAFQVYCDMTTDGGGWTIVMSNPVQNTTYDPFVDFGSVALPGNGNYSIWSKSSLITYTEILYKPSYAPLQWASMTTAQPGYFKWTDSNGNLSSRQAVYSTSFSVGRTNQYSTTGCSGYEGTGAYGLAIYEGPVTWCSPNGTEVGFGLFSGDPRGCHRDGMMWTWGTTPGGNNVCPIPAQWKSGYTLIGIRNTNTTSISKSNDGNVKIEGTGSMKLQVGTPQMDSRTVGLWHMDETSGTGAYIKSATSPVATTTTFNYTGGNQTFTVPGDVSSITVKTWGAGGGSTNYGVTTTGGGGAYATSTLNVTPGEALTVDVGGGGGGGTGCVANSGGGGGGGGGYGTGGAGGNAGPTGCSTGGGGGGAGSFVRRSSTVLIAAGGGGGGAGAEGGGGAGAGGGGGVNGTNGTCSSVGGTAGGSGSVNGTNGGQSGGDASGGGGGGGGYNGGTGGGAPGCDGSGGAGGGGGNSLGTTVNNGSGITPGNSADSDRGTAGNGGSGGAGTAGKVVISYTTANPGTPTGTSVVDGFYGKARSFNGTSDYVASSGNVGITGAAARSVEFWLYPTRTSNEAFWGWGAGSTNNFFEAGNWYNNNWSFHCYSCNWDTGVAVSPYLNKWSHHVITFDGTYVRWYINGSQIGTSPALSLNTGNSPLAIGRAQHSSTYYFQGRIDEIKISNTARTAEEIAEAYRAGRDHRLERTITSTDLSAKSKLPFYIASDRPGTFLEATVGESAYANYSADANTVGLWHLEEAAGSGAYIKDSSSNANNGTPTGTTNVAGKLGKARSFPGSAGNHIRVSSFTAINKTSGQEITVEAWIKPSWSSGYGDIVVNRTDAAYNWMLYQHTTDGSIQFHGSAQNKSTYIPPNNVWTHIAATVNSSGVYTLYANGEIKQTVTGYTYNAQSPSELSIGDFGSNNEPWNGQIDEVRISNTARSADEIRQAYEIGKRTHPITIDFVSKPQAAYASGTTVTVLNPWGSAQLTDTLKVGDTIIFKENVGGTETVSQAVVSAIANTAATYGTVTLAAAPTFPSGGYTTNATVFKWQREYFDLTGSLATHRDAITRLTLRVTDGAQGRALWLDDFRSNTNYINDNTPDSFDTATGIGTYSNTSIPSTLNRYFQYRALLSSWDTPVSPQLVSAQLNYTSNSTPGIPAISAPINGASNISTLATFALSATDSDNDYLQYKIQIATDNAFSQNLQTFNQTVTQQGWSGQNAQTSTAYNSGSMANYAVVSALTQNTTYYARAYALDPAGSNLWSSASSVISFTTAGIPNVPTISSPANGATGVSPSPAITLSATDGQSDYLRYKIDLATDSGFSANLQTFTQPSGTPQTGWTLSDGSSPPNAQSGTAYTSGTAATYTLQAALTQGGTYYIRAYAIDPGGSNVWSGTSSTISFTTGGKPNLPSLDTANGSTACPGSSLTLKTTATDSQNDYLKYKIQICTDAGMTTGCTTYDQTSSQTNWSGQNTQSYAAYTSGTQATYTIPTSSFTANTTYYWRSYAIDPGGSNAWSNTQASPFSFTMGGLISAPTLTGPANGATGLGLTPTFLLSSTNICSNYQRYKIQIATDTGFTQNLQTFDSAVSIRGWGTYRGLLKPDSPTVPGAYNSGTVASYTIQSSLSEGTTYYWRAYATDPAGYNQSSSPSSTYSFTTILGSAGSPGTCRVNYDASATSNNVTVSWTNTSTTANQSVVQKSTDGGGYSTLNTVTSATVSITDTVTTGHTYQYRIQAQNTTSGVNSGWCTTSPLAI